MIRAHSASQLISLFLFLFLYSLIHLLGYAFGVPEIYGFAGYTKMALHTAAGFLLLGMAGLFAYPAKGFIAIVVDTTIGGYIARRILPLSVLLPVIILAFKLVVERSSLFTPGSGHHFISIVLIIIFLTLSWRFLVSINALDNRQKEAETRSREWQEPMDYVIRYDPNSIAVFDRDLRYIFVSDRFLKDYRLTDTAIIGKCHYDVFPDVPDRWKDIHRRALRGEIVRCDEDEFVRTDGQVDYIRWECRPWYGRNETIGGIILYTEVITGRKKVEMRLRRTANQLGLVLEHAGDGIFAVDRQGNAVLINRAALEMLGYDEGELMGRRMHDYHHHTKADGDSFPHEECAIYRAYHEGKAHIVSDELFWRKDGTSFSAEYVSSPIVEDGEVIGAVVSFRDITDRKNAEGRILHALREKEALLRELFHRTNNNMQTIQAMMLLQSSRHPDTPLPSFVKLIRQRIDTMALVHRKLYASKDLSRIHLGDYLADLAHLALANYTSLAGRVGLGLNLAPVSVLFDTAVPVGLVVHELITNVINHAFPGDRTGELRITLSEKEGGAIELVVSDNGRGYDGTFDVCTLNSVGLPVVFSLVREQLRGEISVVSDGGMRFTVRFRDDLYRERV